MRYWAFIDKFGNWQGNRPLTNAQYRAIHTALAGKRPEFVSLNTYDQNENQTSLRLVFDLDSPDTDKARHETTEVVATVARLTNAQPHIFFSGNKGYHIETNYHIEGERAHEVALSITRNLFPTLATLDRSIYRTRSMFRLPDSPASKPGFFKVRLDPQDLDLPADYHRELSARRIHFLPEIVETPNFSRLAEMALQSLKTLPALPSYSQDDLVQQGQDLIPQPCIARLANKPPLEGTRHLTIFVLVRHHKQFGKTEDETIAILRGNPHFADLHKEINQVTRSLYRSTRPMQVGCKGLSNEAALMRDNCDDWCPFSTVPLPTLKGTT